MRRIVTRRLLARQDICLFCAFGHGLELRASTPIRPQRRLYRSSPASQRPAGAAAARIEEDEDDSPSPAPARELLGWKCRCNHVNAPRRSECTICMTSRPQKPELVYKGTKPPPPPPSTPRPPAPARAPSSPNLGYASARKPQVAQNLRRQDAVAGRPSRQPQSNTNTVLEQASTNFRSQQPVIRYGPGPRDGPTRRDRGEYNARDRDHQRSTQDSGPRIRFTGLTPGSQVMDSPLDRQASQPANHGFPRRPFTRMEDRPPSRNDDLRDGTLANNEQQRRTDWRRDSAVKPPLPPQTRTPDLPTNSRIGSAITPMNRGRSNDRSSPNDSFSGLFNARESRGEPPRRDRPPQEAKSTWQPMIDRNARRRDPESTAGGPVQRGLPSEEIGDVSEVAPPIETEEVRSARKMRAEKERDRRSKIYDIEEEEPVYTSQTARTPSGKRRPSYRNSAPAFDPDMVEDILEGKRQKRKSKHARPAAVEQRPEIQIPEFITVEKLAQGLKVRLPEFLERLEQEGFEGARYDHVLDSGTSAMFAEIYGFEPIVDAIDESGDLVARPPAEDPSVLPPRPPIVTIMGHVDHGKTTILDYFRKSSVVASEHGGITQHIGAFSVVMPGSERNITFLDTPGHAAFLDMRRRGANVTDIVVLVVAADDSVKAQTKEAIKHALEANVEIIVAINKIDKDGADIEGVKRDLSAHDILVEDWGGDFQAIPVSGKTGQGMADLEEAILTLADVHDFRAEIDGPAEGWIIESKVGASGRVATVLVRRGTLRPGDFIVAGTTWARVRTLRNDAGQLIEEAPPGTPVQIDGWRGDDPMAGSEVLQAADEQQAKDAVAIRQEKEESVRAIGNMSAINTSRTEEAEARAKVLEWEQEQGYMNMKAYRRPKDNEGWVEKESSGPRQVHFVIKADVAGSTEALVAAVGAIGNKEIVANIIHNGTGELTESDIKLLAATGEVGYAISFNQPIDNGIRRLAEAANLQILDHNIIYKVTDVVAEKLSDELPPIVSHKVLGEAEVGDIFEITVKKAKMRIAGCRVTNGTIRRSEKIRVLRDGEVVYTGMLNSFKNIKKDVTEMRKGSECGMGFENWDGFEVGDQIQSFEEIHEKRSLY
ncbi:translation initiation factor IF-2 [Exophiala xenobiotica]|nr:translation initiation factor IF-2 [Exophiala xenobiotica]KAK5393343.1 translation initiation factor IF-2 [Exophiala xenobiotica]KAK5420381.1 translation initiation factor IF-2 [Exophiala xenobiotica]KAK5469285.1 translation initiation factor IF-2 [Exophiala xenobiotica]KAK5476354.1 translation initiation factor IF-2 [Exophiala xenobiotica]